jgi:hypothetical protein
VDAEIGLAILVFLNADLLAGHVGKGDGEIGSGLCILLADFRGIAVVDLFEADATAVRTAATVGVTIREQGKHVSGDGIDFKVEAVERLVDAQRKAVIGIEAMAARLLSGGSSEVADVANPDLTTALGGDRVNTSAEVAAFDPLGQTRIDTSPFFLLEGNPGLFSGDNDAIDHLPIDIQGIAAESRTLGEREVQLPFEDAVVGIAESHRESGACKVADDGDIRVERGERERLRGLVRFELDENGWRNTDTGLGEERRYRGLGSSGGTGKEPFTAEESDGEEGRKEAARSFTARRQATKKERNISYHSERRGTQRKSRSVSQF